MSFITKNDKISFRVLVKTISFGSYNIILNLNHSDDREFFEDEIKIVKNLSILFIMRSCDG